MAIMHSMVDLAVVGGGAGGYFAAITYAEQRARKDGKPGGSVILEKAPRPLRKVLISGGGRCNVTHACDDLTLLASNYPRGAAELRGAFTRFQPADTVAWFQEHGVNLKTEADGRIFPVSDSARSIVDCLVSTAHRDGIELWTHGNVVAIEAPASEGNPFTLHIQSGVAEPGPSDGLDLLLARQVILATGGEAGGMRLAGSLGHTIEPPVPSLFTFTISDPRLDGLTGVSVPEVELRLVDETGRPPGQAGLPQSGALMVTHWGLSGPAVLRLSAWGARWLNAQGYQAGLAVNWLYPLRQDQVLIKLQTARQTPFTARQTASANHPFQRLSLRLWKRLVQAAGISAGLNWGDLSKGQLGRLAAELTEARYTIMGKGPFKEEFVTCGGVRLAEVNFKTMESKLTPGLFLVGEVLDVDGLTGGFNFQNAWTTGWIAGASAAGHGAVKACR